LYSKGNLQQNTISNFTLMRGI